MQRPVRCAPHTSARRDGARCLVRPAPSCLAIAASGCLDCRLIAAAVRRDITDARRSHHAVRCPLAARPTHEAHTTTKWPAPLGAGNASGSGRHASRSFLLCHPAVLQRRCLPHLQHAGSTRRMSRDLRRRMYDLSITRERKGASRAGRD
eukprot:6463676-Prymnesium_polylepis.1